MPPFTPVFPSKIVAAAVATEQGGLYLMEPGEEPNQWSCVIDEGGVTVEAIVTFEDGRVERHPISSYPVQPGMKLNLELNGVGTHS